MAYPLILGGVVSALLIAPIGIGGDFRYGAWLCVGFVIAGVTLILDRLLRIAFDHWTLTRAFVLIPILASCFGILAGWWTVNYTMGGPV